MGIRATQPINQSPDVSGGPSSQTIQQVTFDLQQMYNFMSMGNANNWADPSAGISANFWAYFSNILSISNPGFTKAQQQALETVDSYFGNMPNPPTSSDYGQILSDIKSALGSFGGSVPSSNPWLNIISTMGSDDETITSDLQAMQNDFEQSNWKQLVADAVSMQNYIGNIMNSIGQLNEKYDPSSGVSIPLLGALGGAWMGLMDITGQVQDMAIQIGEGDDPTGNALLQLTTLMNLGFPAAQSTLQQLLTEYAQPS
ncbi:MAG: hypothetical protein HY860_06035 [Chlamydiales bacterium]|nr:hypothetical protein [Chlamydiales bacterium]